MKPFNCGTILFAFGIVLSFLSLDSFAEEATATPHVILLVIDGERYSETWGSPDRNNIPQRSTQLAPQGTLLTHCYNSGNTYTLPGHGSLLTGHNDALQGNGTDYPSHPSLFQLLLAKGTPREKAWFVTSKEKLHVLVNCSDPAWKDRFIASSDCGSQSGNRDDSETMELAKKILLQHEPLFLAINLKDPDIAAHQRDWDGYIKAIKTSDELASSFWKWIQAQPALRNTTTLIITNDHGRHVEGRLEGFISHGDRCSGCKHIGCLLLGPRIRANAVLHEQYSQSDIAATLAYFLGVQIENSDGKVIKNAIVPAAEDAKSVSKN